MSGAMVLLRPWWLLALPAILAAAVWAWRLRSAGAWGRVVAPELMAALKRLDRITHGLRGKTMVLPFVAAGVTAAALSGPALLRPGAVAFRALDPMILMLDMSPSVVADARVLGEAQAAAAGLLAGADGRPVGLLLYAADAYLASAPTSDADSLLGLVGVLGEGTMPVVGSRPDIALSMARDLFGATEGPGIGGADLVVISDGGGAGPRATEEAARLAHDGARVWALVLPQSAEGAPAPDRTGLARMAEAGGGTALPAAQAPDLLRQIAQRRTARLVEDPQTGAAFADMGPWLLPLALLALFPMFRRQR
ncbi:MAG: VWA domain-containing protein [Paracoccaceae bacterium]